MSDTLPTCVARSGTRTLLWRALAAGETFHKHSAAAKFGWSVSTADDFLGEMHRLQLVHIVGWTRNGSRGPKTKVVAFGPGIDVDRPEKLSNAFVCQRWRNRHHEQAIAIDRRTRARRLAKAGALPKGRDPLLFAIMGMNAA